MKIRHQSLRVQDLHRIKRQIHLNPAWQRGPVWSRPKQALLIDSILRGYDVPMIYLREMPPDATFRYEVVDGQQRLRAIWEFSDGAYSLSKELEPVGAAQVAGKFYNDLSVRLRKQINGFRIVVAYVKGAREPEISRLFSRMQMGVRLNPAELRNAVQTPLRHAIDGIAREHKFFRESRIQAGRFRHQDYMAHAFTQCFHDGAVDLKAPELMRDYEKTRKDGDYAPLMGIAYDVLDFLRLVNQKAGKGITQKWMFVDLFFFLFQHQRKLKPGYVDAFAAEYIKFDRERLAYTSNPEKLLEGKPSKQARDLYEYIQAFRISGGEKKSVQKRNQILLRRFAKVWGGS